MVGSGDLKGCNDVWGERRIRGQLFQLKSRANLSYQRGQSPRRKGNAVLIYSLCVKYALWSKTARKHEGLPSIKRDCLFVEMLRIDSFDALLADHHRESIGVGGGCGVALWTNQNVLHVNRGVLTMPLVVD